MLKTEKRCVAAIRPAPARQGQPKCFWEAAQEHDVDPRSFCRVASIDIKSDEAGLAAFAEKWGLPLCFYSAEELRAVKGTFHESAFVEKAVGVGNVCERAAMKTVAGKSTLEGVTVAFGLEDWSVRF